MSYAGELGYEIHGDMDAIGEIYDALWASGEKHGVADYGSFAMNAMRMEKMFKGAGELTNEVTFPEADVMRFVKMDKNFVGKDKTEVSLAQAEEGTMPWVCAYLEAEADGEADGNGGEAVMVDGQQVGSTTSMAYGHSVGKILAFAYVKPEALTATGKVEIMIMNKPRAAKFINDAVYDPENLLPRGN